MARTDPRRSLLRRIEIEMISAHNSIEFWTAELARNPQGAFKGAVQRSLHNALVRLEQLQATKKLVEKA